MHKFSFYSECVFKPTQNPLHVLKVHIGFSFPFHTIHCYPLALLVCSPFHFSLSLWVLSLGTWPLLGVVLSAVGKWEAALQLGVCKTSFPNNCCRQQQFFCFVHAKKVLVTNAFPVFLAYCSIFHTCGEEEIPVWKPYFIVISGTFKILLQWHGKECR